MTLQFNMTVGELQWCIDETREDGDAEQKALCCSNCDVVSFAAIDDYVCMVCRDGMDNGEDLEAIKVERAPLVLSEPWSTTDGIDAS
jgi:hypothetical protein